MKRQFVVYIATNTVNGNCYIGATSRGLERRKNQHVWDARQKRGGCRVFNAALRKYGEDAFRWTVIARASSFEEMMRKEVRLIAELKPEYNVTIGGQGIKGLERTKKWRARMSRALKGRKPSQACADAMRATGWSYNFKSIVCLNDGKFFESVKAATVFYGLGKGNIGEVLAGRQMLAGGLSFVKSKRPLTQEEISAELGKVDEKRRAWDVRRNQDKCRAVVRLDTNETFPSARAAWRATGIDPVRIMQLCQKGGVTRGNISFRYAGSKAVIMVERTEAQKKKAKHLRLAGLARGQAKIRKPIVFIATGQVYWSIADAARAHGLKENSLYGAVAEQRAYKGLLFQRVPL